MSKIRFTITIVQEMREHTARQKLEEKIKRDSTIMTKISDQSSEASENQKWAEEKMLQSGSLFLFKIVFGFLLNSI